MQTAFPVARRPFAEQRRFIDAALAEAPLEPLLRALAAEADPAPLAHAIDRLATLDRVDATLAAVLPAVPDAHLARALRGLPDHRPATPGPLVDAVAAALDALPAERIAAACFLIRWLRRADPARWRALEAAAIDRAAALDPAALDDATLLRIPGAAWAPLADRAAARHRAAAWSARLAAFAARVLDALGATPKTLSQAGAEELLSRRVYTDPAHFVMELLQNAEDADARRFALWIDGDALVVEHDGAPFDARDVVGVLSIGQTTKIGDRIGTFGVGFKSVYAVGDRPRLHSGPFDFEIADVSIPRRLDARPADLPPGATRLVLPLRAPADPIAGAAAITTRAAALPAVTLLTLRAITAIDITGPGVRRRLRREATDAAPHVDPPPTDAAPHVDQPPTDATPPANDAAPPANDAAAPLHDRAPRRADAPDAAPTVTLTDGEHTRHLWIETDRDTGADTIEASVLVAIALDPSGRPTSLPPDEPTVYCYLPTRERPGLRLAIHARFALPVDRERVDTDDPRTQRALRHAGRLLARRLARGAWLEALLAVLPHPDAL
ncbi:MAG: hypothetical protein R3F65_21060, partial [bacterium]